MKNASALLLIFLTTTTCTTATSVDLNGSVKLNYLWTVNDGKLKPFKYTFNEADIFTTFEGDEVSGKLRFKGRLWNTDDENFDLIPWEIFVQINDFPFKNASLKIGKQYFEWGTADGIHPTSVLNPDDYSSAFSIGDKIPVNAVKFYFFTDSFNITAVWIPFFRQANYGFSEEIFTSRSDGEVAEVELPDVGGEGSGGAVKVGLSVFDVDLSVGIYRGYDYIKQIKQITITTSNTAICYAFPRMTAYLFDFTTSIAGIGFWGEMAVYDFDKFSTITTTPFYSTTNTILDKPYPSFVVGGDYTFESGFYINIQYARGMPIVRGTEHLENYIIATLKDDFLDGDLEVSIGGIAGFKKMSAVKDEYEIMAFQQLSYSITEDVQLKLSLSQIDAKGDVLFFMWRDYDSVSLTAELSF